MSAQYIYTKNELQNMEAQMRSKSFWQGMHQKHFELVDLKSYVYKLLTQHTNNTTMAFANEN